MSNNVYETAKINYAKKLKENENAIRRLKTKLEKSMKNDPKAQEYQKRLEEFNGDLEENKDEFVRDTKYALSKVFFSTLLYGASDEIKIINEYPDIIDLSFLEVLHQDLYRLDYDGCVKILKDEGLKNTFNLENKESGLAKAYQQIQRTIEECEKETNKCLLDCIALDKKRKRFSFFKTANYNKKIQRKINERYQDFQEYDMLQKALISLSKKIKKACETYNSLAENLDSNKNYANVKLNQSLIRSYKKSMGDRKTWINYQSGIEEEIENLRSKETKMKLLSECFDEETRKGLAEDPNFLIELGKASVKESQELTDKTIVDFLINKYIENENELQK